MMCSNFLLKPMAKAGSPPEVTPGPLWLLAELTYACPLQCPYCSNPVDFARIKDELDTDAWIRVLREARTLGAAQLGFSGGEPLIRRDLEVLVEEGRRLGYYTNLITSGVGMDADRVRRLGDAGLDHIQLSIQASNSELNDLIAGTGSFEHKIAMAREVKANGFPMVLNFVVHRDNIDYMGDMLDLAVELEADYVELANAQYYGWALVNRDRLLPTRDQIARAQAVAEDYQQRYSGGMKIYYVIPDYYENRPKACMDGWGKVFLSIAPDGTALPCQAARSLPGIDYPNVRDKDVRWIWHESDAFNRFRGDAWMKEPCRSCPERSKDYGGCRCQAYLLTGDAANADPVCDKSVHHEVVLEAVDRVQASDAGGVDIPLVYRNTRNSKSRATG
jgi:pyrroloquinoline quinone biosynthesis protein E